jgi:hypothetical protein
VKNPVISQKIILLQTCLHGEYGRPPHKNILLFFIAPNVIANILPIVVDVTTVLYVKRYTMGSTAPTPSGTPLINLRNIKRLIRRRTDQVLNVQTLPDILISQPHIKRKNVLEIPLKATVLSSFSAIPYLLLGSVVGNLDIPLSVRAYVLTFGSLLVNILRCTVVVSTIFKSNQANQVLM